MDFAKEKKVNKWGIQIWRIWCKDECSIYLLNDGNNNDGARKVNNQLPYLFEELAYPIPPKHFKLQKNEAIGVSNYLFHLLHIELIF